MKKSSMGSASNTEKVSHLSMRSLLDAWLVMLLMLWTTVCAYACVFGLLRGEKMTLLASATLDEAHFGSCAVLLLTDTHTQTQTRTLTGTSSCGYEHTCTEADCSGSLGVFVSLGVTVRQSPAGVAAGH